MPPPSQIASFALDLLRSSPLLACSQHISSPQIALASMFSLHHCAISQASFTLLKHILVPSEASISRVSLVNMQFLLLCHVFGFLVRWKGFETWVQGVGRNCKATTRIPWDLSSNLRGWPLPYVLKFALKNGWIWDMFKPAFSIMGICIAFWSMPYDSLHQLRTIWVFMSSLLLL